MMRKRVLIVDDSALTREFLSELLDATTDLQVVGTARDLESAWHLLSSLRPDVLTLDIEMPGADGIAFLRRLMREQPLPVVVVSALTARSSELCVRALAYGALEVVEKPRVQLRAGAMAAATDIIDKVRAAARARVVSGHFRGSEARSFDPETPSIAPRGLDSTPRVTLTPRGLDSTPRVTLTPRGLDSTPRVTLIPRSSLVPRGAIQPVEIVRAMPATVSTPRASQHPGALRPALRNPISEPPQGSRQSTPWTAGKIVAIGASTGGTEALALVLQKLPADAPPVVVVQHMPQEFTKAFAARLDRLCRVSVKEAADGDAARPGTVLVAPGGRHMRLVRSVDSFVVRISDDAPVGLHRPSVDVLFESCARAAGVLALGIILTGMGADGAAGLGEMRKAGALTIAQDEASCVVFGMPKEAIARGAAAHVFPLDRIAGAIVRFSV